MPQLVFAHGIRMIDLVAQNQKRRLVEILHTQQRIQFCLALCESLGVFRIHQEDDSGDFGEVVTPEPSGLLMAAQVEGREAAAADAEFFGGGMEGGLEDCYPVVFEHVEELERSLELLA